MASRSTRVLAAAVAMCAGITLSATSSPAQAAVPKIACTNPGNGELCVHLWNTGRVAVSYKKVAGEGIRGNLSWWDNPPSVAKHEVVPPTDMVAGRTYSGYYDSVRRRGACYHGKLEYRLHWYSDFHTVNTPAVCLR